MEDVYYGRGHYGQPCSLGRELPTAAQDEPPPRVKVAALLNLPPVAKLGAPVL